MIPRTSSSFDIGGSSCVRWSWSPLGFWGGRRKTTFWMKLTLISQGWKSVESILEDCSSGYHGACTSSWYMEKIRAPELIKVRKDTLLGSTAAPVLKLYPEISFLPGAWAPAGPSHLHLTTTRLGPPWTSRHALTRCGSRSSGSGSTPSLYVHLINLVRTKRIIGIGTCAAVLKQRNVTMTSPLVDADGFPLPGLDIAAVRTARQQIRMLTNDRQKIDAQLKALLECALGQKPSTGTTSAAGDTVPTRNDVRSSDAPMDVDMHTTAPVSTADDTRHTDPPVVQPRPIAVRSVSPESPAAAVGLKAGDTLTAFGDLQHVTSAHFSQLASQVRDGVSIPVGVERITDDGRKVLLTLTLTPSSTWGGRGMLGYVVRNAHLAAIWSLRRLPIDVLFPRLILLRFALPQTQCRIRGRAAAGSRRAISLATSSLPHPTCMQGSVGTACGWGSRCRPI